MLLTVLFCALALQTPDIEAAAAVHSCKIERGMCENPDPIWGLEAEIAWYGAFAGIEALYDLTDSNGRRGRYNEITPFAGYEWAACTWLTLDAAYRFKQEPDAHTHEIAACARCPLAWFTPFARFELDVGRDPGALYGVLGVERSVELCSVLELVLDGGFGFGNARRNEADFGRDAIGARDIHVGVGCRCRLCKHLYLCPYCRAYQQCTAQARAEYHNGFYVAAGCALAADF